MSRKIVGTEEKDVSDFDIESESVEEKTLDDAVKTGLSDPFIRIILRLIPAICLVVSICIFITGMMKFGELHKRQAELEEQKEAYEYEIEELQYLIDSPVDYEYIVRVAKEKLGLHLPDEIIYYNDTND